MDIYEKRRLNLLRIQSQFRHQKDLADALGLAPAYVSQLLAESKKKGSRNIGERSARKIEKKLNLQKFYLDELHSNSVEDASAPLDAASPRSGRLIRRIIEASEEGRLDDAAIEMLDQLVQRLAGGYKR